MARKTEGLGTFAEGMAESIPHEAAYVPALDLVERCAFCLLDRCEETEGRVTFG